MRFVISLLLMFLCVGAVSAETAESTAATAETRSRVYINRSFSLGGWMSMGNSESQSLNSNFSLRRYQPWGREVSARGSLYHSSTPSSKFLRLTASLRYAYYLGKSFNNYYQVRMSYSAYNSAQNEDFRLIPAVGLAYWIINEKDAEWQVEGAVGYEKSYIIGSYRNDAAVLELGTYLRLGDFSNDLNIYAGVNDSDNYRVSNSAAYRLRINKHYYFRVSLTNEYDNQPPVGWQKSDTYISVGIQYYFWYNFQPR